MLEKTERLLDENNLGILLSRPCDGCPNIHIFDKETFNVTTFNIYNSRIDGYIPYYRVEDVKFYLYNIERFSLSDRMIYDIITNDRPALNAHSTLLNRIINNFTRYLRYNGLI